MWLGPLYLVTFCTCEKHSRTNRDNSTNTKIHMVVLIAIFQIWAINLYQYLQLLSLTQTSRHFWLLFDNKIQMRHKNSIKTLKQNFDLFFEPTKVWKIGGLSKLERSLTLNENRTFRFIFVYFSLWMWNKFKRLETTYGKLPNEDYLWPALFFSSI